MAKDNLTMETVKGILEDLMANRLPETVAKQFEPLKKQMGEFLKAGGKGGAPLNLGAGEDADNTGDNGAYAKSAQPRPFKGLGDFARAVAAADSGRVDRGLGEIATKAPLGATEGVGADGGFLVQQDIAGEIFTRINSTGILLNGTGIKRLPISANSNGLSIPAIDEISRADGSRMGGVQVFRQAEGMTGTVKRPKYRMIDLKLKKMLGFSYVTEELLQDASALGQFLQMSFAEEFGFKMDQEIFAGNGAEQMLGVTSKNNKSLIVVGKEGSQTTGTIVSANILKMWARMFGRSWLNANWYINQDTIPQLSQMSITVGTGGIPVWMPAGGFGGLSTQPYSTLFGRPVRPLEQASTVGTQGDVSLLDLEQYVMIEKGGIQGAMSAHLKFDTDELAFRWTLRNDGAPLWSSALTPNQGSNTLSPFVVLATRG
jgi:HK97 family phage major capsid protein